MRLTRCLRFLEDKKAIPNQRSASLWQDPILGYFETHGKMEFKPGEEYDLTDEQKKRVMERYLRKEKLKRDYLSMQYNPQRYNYIQGVVVDPSLFRWYATEMSNIERFRTTPRSVFMAFALLYFLYFMYQRIATKPMLTLYEKSSKGEILWWDRGVRNSTEGGSGAAWTGQLN